MKKEHKVLLHKLQDLIDEMSLAAEQDEKFNEALGELNRQQNLFGASLDEYDINKYLKER